LSRNYFSLQYEASQLEITELNVAHKKELARIELEMRMQAEDFLNQVSAGSERVSLLKCNLYEW